MSDQPEPWSLRAQGAAVAVAVGIAVFLFQYWWSPRPGVEAYGLGVIYATPSAPDTARTYWSLQVTNSGNRQASAVRLDVPTITSALVRGQLLEAAEGAALPPLDLGTLQPLEKVFVSAWGGDSTLTFAAGVKVTVTHADGIGYVDVKAPENPAVTWWARKPSFFSSLSIVAFVTVVILGLGKGFQAAVRYAVKP